MAQTVQKPVLMIDQIAQETIITATKMIEYFKNNLIYYQLISGKGLEFDRIKEYVPGNDPRRIDWKKLAKSGTLNIRAFKEERHFEIIIVVDTSNSMLLGTNNKTKAEYTAVASGALAYASLEAGDEVALITINSENVVAMDPTSEFNELLTIITNTNNYGGQKDWQKLT